MSAPTGYLSLDQLRSAVADGHVDTVIVAFTDMQGRLVGKRVSARLFLEDVAAHGAEACNYLLAVDVEMNTVDGYAMSSWERGYGDMALIPDFTTLRAAPWLEATALVTADLQWLDGTPVEASPRRILQRQLDRLAERGLTAFVGTELEFIVFDDSLPRRLAQGLPRPDARQRLQHRLRAARVHAHGAAAPRHPELDGRRGHVLRGREGRVQPRAAGDRLPLHRRARHLRQPLDLQERREGDRRPARQVAHLHGEVQRARGQQLPHPHLAARRGRRGRLQRPGCPARHVEALPPLPRRPARRHARAHALLRAEHQLLQALRRRAASPRPRSPGGSTTARARCGSSATATACASRTGCPAAT